MYQQKRKEIEFFDEIAKHSDWEWIGRRGYITFIKYFEKLVKQENKKKEKLLDAGCGTAEFTSKLKKFDLELYGIDISPIVIDVAKKTKKDIKFYVRDIENTKFKNNTFDIVVFSAVLHHFPDFSNVLKEAYRILKPNGRIFAYDPHYYNPVMWLFRAENSPISTKRNRTENERLLKKKKLKENFLRQVFQKLK